MTRAAIRPAIKAAIEASASLPGITVVVEDSTKENAEAQEAALRSPGYVVVIPPLFGSSTTDKSRGPRLAELAEAVVYLRRRNGVVWDIDGGIDAIISAVLSATDTLDARTDERITSRVEEDLGCLTYAINFLIPITQPTT